MPSAMPLTQRADAGLDRLLQALWDDRSSAEEPQDIVTPIGTGSTFEPASVMFFRPVDLYGRDSFGSSRLAYTSSFLASPNKILFGSSPSEHRLGGARFAERFEALRSKLRMPVQKYARLLGTSRRTLYYWLETDRPQPLAVDLIERLDEWVTELERHLTTAEIQRALDPEAADSIGALLLEEGLDSAAARVRLLTEEVPTLRRARRLDALVDDQIGEPPTATREELRAAFAAFAKPRHPTGPSVKSEPPELTY